MFSPILMPLKQNYESVREREREKQGGRVETNSHRQTEDERRHGTLAELAVCLSALCVSFYDTLALYVEMSLFPVCAPSKGLRLSYVLPIRGTRSPPH